MQTTAARQSAPGPSDSCTKLRHYKQIQLNNNYILDAGGTGKTATAVTMAKNQEALGGGVLAAGNYWNFLPKGR